MVEYLLFTMHVWFELNTSTVIGVNATGFRHTIAVSTGDQNLVTSLLANFDKHFDVGRPGKYTPEYVGCK